jgi:hypothetical protein
LSKKKTAHTGGTKLRLLLNEADISDYPPSMQIIFSVAAGEQDFYIMVDPPDLLNHGFGVLLRYDNIEDEKASRKVL